MKSMKIGEIRDRSDDELKELARQTSDELFKARLKRFTNQLENTMTIRAKRRELARIRTIMTARARGSEPHKGTGTTQASEAKEQ
ncbi:MAG: 50S ribosomal protein L29 [Deltaproteobacteria bacterium]|nr:50S ribosomal protein L29 [Deltaproteobacteria bacterium]